MLLMTSPEVVCHGREKRAPSEPDAFPHLPVALMAVGALVRPVNFETRKIVIIAALICSACLRVSGALCWWGAF